MSPVHTDLVLIIGLFTILLHFIYLSSFKTNILSHPHLVNVYPSLHDELLLNTLHPIEERTFCQLLIKAIKIHQIAATKYRNDLICKYYKKEYNIIRNTPISIAHILALIIYTDLSQFCTAFRQTYRKLDGETTTKDVERTKGCRPGRSFCRR